MPKLTVYIKANGDRDCPPKRDLGGRLKLNERWENFEKGEQSPKTWQVKPGDHYIFCKTPTVADECVYEPVAGFKRVHVEDKDVVVCLDFKCTPWSSAVERLKGEYIAKRPDVPGEFKAKMRLVRNGQYCVAVTISSPGVVDEAKGFAHMHTEPGRHGSGTRIHPGDGLEPRAPLSAGLMQGTYRARGGQSGTFLLKLVLEPAKKRGYQQVIWQGRFSASTGDSFDITFTKRHSVNWALHPPV